MRCGLEELPSPLGFSRSCCPISTIYSLPALRGVLHDRYGFKVSYLQLWTWATAGAFPCQRVVTRDGGNARLFVREADLPEITTALPKLLACTRRAQG